MQLQSHNRRCSSHTVGGNHGNQYAGIVRERKKKKWRTERGWCKGKNNSLSVSVKGRSLGDAVKETIPYGLANVTVL